MVRAEGELAAEVEALLADAENLDAAEDAAYGPDRRGDELPAELGRREGRLAAIRAGKAALEAEHRAKARAQAEPLKGKADYARRKAIVGPVFGQMKVAQDAERFRLRGTDKTDGEWALHTLCHNLRKLQGSGWTPLMVI